MNLAFSCMATRLAWAALLCAAACDSNPTVTTDASALEQNPDAGFDTGTAASDTQPPTCEPRFRDSDQDGYGDPLKPQSNCRFQPGYVTNADDCDDARSAVHPQAVELCGSSEDLNCDARAPEPCEGALAAGGQHTCALRASGRVYCWGQNQDGELGDGTTSESMTPVRVRSIEDVVQVSAGALHSCAVRRSGTVACWGENDDGRLGDLGASIGRSPTEVRDLTNVVQVSVGGDHACAARADGTAACWGKNVYGEVGVDRAQDYESPIEIEAIANARAFAVGDTHSCFLDSTGAVSCFGANDFGQLGASGSATSIPQRVIGLTSVSALAAGAAHSCALVAGEVWCWGKNDRGQLGNDSTASSARPVRVAGITAATAISLGKAHSCALLERGNLSCWGAGDFGQLGTGALEDAHTARSISTAANLRQVALGRHHTCVVDNNGQVFCWGRNERQQLGREALLSSLSPRPVSGVSELDGLSAGAKHVCARSRFGDLSCWGDNSQGQLGNGTTLLTDHVTTRVLDLGEKINAGAEHTCAIRGSEALCWGEGEYGQLGAGSYLDALLPSPTTFARIDVAEISSGGRHTCTITDEHEVYCWGDNTYRQLGTGSAQPKSARPVWLSDIFGLDGAPQVTSLSSGTEHTCAVRSDGRALCWGRNADGQLGSNSTADRAAAKSVRTILSQDLTGVTNVSAGDRHSCAVANGDVYCWGAGDFGQLGNGTTSGRTTATQVVFTGAARRVAASHTHTCALSTEGDVYCWGDNRFGQLGDGTRSNRGRPTLVMGLSHVDELTLGERFTCATSGSLAYCWGDNTEGELGASYAARPPLEAIRVPAE